MYQYSLQFFAGLFQQRLASSTKDPDTAMRIAIVLKDFTEFIFINICRGLFEDHKLLFSFLITAQILRNVGHSSFLGREAVTSSQWLFFLRGAEAGKGVIEDR